VAQLRGPVQRRHLTLRSIGARVSQGAARD
jgi:hypothetical protein